MGALYGYFTTSSTDLKEVKHMMSNPAIYWGRDSHFYFSGNSILIGLLHRFNTPESVFEIQPYKTTGNDIIFFNGRIDNREDLFRKTGIAENKEVSDGKLVSACWERYRSDIVNHLEGDWVVVVWDADREKLCILRDHHGYSSFYYHCGKDFFAFATSIKSLLALKNIPQNPDMKRVAQVLTSWHGKGLTSAYENILRLPPAHILEINKKPEVKLIRYWFPENTETIRFSNEKEYYEKFFEEYSRAVKVRLRSHNAVGSQLSGGLDSGTVTTLAAVHLKKDGKRLPAFTSVPAFNVDGLTSKNRFGDEGRFAKMTADFNGNTDWFPVPAENVDPFEAVRNGIEIHDEPFHAGANTYWISEIKRVAAEMKIGTMLTGQGGNATVSWPTPGFLRLMSGKKDLVKAKDFFTYYGWRNVLLPMVTPSSVKNYAKRKKGGSMPFLRYSAMKSEYAIANKIAEQMKEEDHDPLFIKAPSPLNTRLKIIKPGSSIVGFLHSQSAAWNNLEMRDPTFDKRLIEYCLSVPDHIYVSGGMDRMLLRRSFEGHMPPEVLWNTCRGRQAADIGHRVVKFSHSGFAMLNEIERSPHCNEILDIKRMKGILSFLCNEVNSRNNTEAGTILLRGITCGLFLLRFEK